MSTGDTRPRIAPLDDSIRPRRTPHMLVAAMALLLAMTTVSLAGPVTLPASTQPATAPASQPAKALSAKESLMSFRDAMVKGQLDDLRRWCWPEYSDEEWQTRAPDLAKEAALFTTQTNTVAIIEGLEEGDCAAVSVLFTTRTRSSVEVNTAIKIQGKWRFLRGDKPTPLSPEQKETLTRLRDVLRQRAQNPEKPQPHAEGQTR